MAERRDLEAYRETLHSFLLLTLLFLMLLVFHFFGENVEPAELEEAAMRSSLIRQIVVIGQDKRHLGAVIVPNKDEVLKAARELSIIDSDTSDVSQEKVTSLIYKELRTWTSKSSFQIGPILLINDPFTIDNGLLTPTMKIRRDRVMAQYKDQIENLYM